MDVGADIDLREALRGIDRMRASAEDAAPVFRSWKPHARRDQQQHGRDQSGPDGRWPGRSAATVARRGRSRRRLLGKLPRVLKVSADRAGLEVESRVAWAGVHQHGGTAGKGARIPARPFLYWAAEFVRAVLDDWREYVLRRW